MNGDKTLANPPDVEPAPVTQLPIGLYESNGLIFELYRGTQPYSSVIIHWERLKTVTVTREGESDSNVHINQSRRQFATNRQQGQ
jgi:hypothetical protein